MFRKLGAIAFGLTLGLAATTPAAAAGNVPIERSGNTFHQAACPHNQRFGVARCFAHVVTDSAGRIKTFPNGRPNFGFTGYTAQDLRSAYNITSYGSSTYTIAIVDAYGYPNAEADMNAYRARYGLPACTSAGSNPCFRKVDQRGGTNYPATNVGWDQEQALDLDMASAMCPNCHILLVQGDDALVSNLAEAVNKAASMGANAISNSYGLGESSSLIAYNSAYNHPGKAITVSSGDSGYGVQFPANSQYVIAVGGTSLTKISGGRGWAEAAWSGAGSGCSAIIAKPGWQNDPLCKMRMVADVSAVADPNTGALVYGPTSSTATGWMIIGGTSLSAPLIAGIYGVNGGTANAGSDPYAHTTALFDVTTGNNGRNCGRTYFCTAGVGYDGPTGLGTPNGPGAF